MRPFEAKKGPFGGIWEAIWATRGPNRPIIGAIWGVFEHWLAGCSGVLRRPKGVIWPNTPQIPPYLGLYIGVFGLGVLRRSSGWQGAQECQKGSYGQIHLKYPLI